MEAQTPPFQTRPHSQNSAPPPSSSSSAARQWRPGAQRNLRNQWSKLNLLRQDWRSASDAGRSHATAIVNSYLSQKYMDGMEFGVLSDMPNIREKASYKLFKQQELERDRLLKSYRDMVQILTDMGRICRSMRYYSIGTSNSPLAQFSISSEDGSDSGDCGGIPVFRFFSIAYFEELAFEITQMFILELNLKRLLVVEFLSIYDEKVAEAKELQWSDELYEGEFNDLATLNLYSVETHKLNPPSLRNCNSSISNMQSKRQQDSNVLQIYITTWLADVNIDKCRMEEIFGIAGGEMHVDFLETFA
ncbi:hypothetical protein SASPL_154951 [Salvia splendens]|uniref:Uncharacterized protein n=1 Tax=Salvia splendens TaxID=180675 RepID=A0A8X8W110_SALSN|nr:uncharacterized protein LOC121786088 [Salvia splendens]KAG6386065.1 hypothetical protein SASPL_154951 [Salvia splendens]